MDDHKPQSESKPEVKLSEFVILGAVLLLALLHGLIYIFLIPPWQHYDEPNHFEYAWWVANRQLPEPGDYDAGMNRQVAESMIVNGFYGDHRYAPDLTAEEVKITGYSQFAEPPLYYTYASLPLRFLNDTNIETQLYAGRAMSLLLYLITITAAWGVTRELTSEGSPLRWIVPLSLVLIPGFTDLMTALNNDVGAIALLSLFLWAGVRLIVRGFSWAALAALIIVTGLALFTKSTAFIALPLLLLVLLLMVIPKRWRWLAWLAVGSAAMLGAFFVFSWGDAAFWARSSGQAENTRLVTSAAPVGETALQLVFDPDDEYSGRVWLKQLLPEDISENLSNKVVTVGAWMWADRPIQVRSPILQTFPGKRVFYRDLIIDENPLFVAYAAELKGGTDRIWLSVQPVSGSPDEAVAIYIDGLMLLEGEYPLSSLPYFDDASASKGTWDEIPFTNLLKNPSAENSWLRLQPWIDKVATRILPDPGVNNPSVALYTVLDVETGQKYYWGAAQTLFRTFWAKFGWGHVPLLGHKPYRPLAAVTLLGMIGFGVLLIAQRKRFPWDAALLLGVGLLAIWAFALFRGSNYVFVMDRIFLPVARYTYPIIIPAVLILVVGWVALMRIPNLWKKNAGRFLIFIPLIFLLALDIYSIISIAQYYGS
ncbi:MAG: hypothetical protein U9R58_03830 [Chloroflexota bacterium]|nr:hypothetical protein [Chloroflexota bacterium]